MGRKMMETKLERKKERGWMNLFKSGRNRIELKERRLAKGKYPPAARSAVIFCWRW